MGENERRQIGGDSGEVRGGNRGGAGETTGDERRKGVCG